MGSGYQGILDKTSLKPLKAKIVKTDRNRIFNMFLEKTLRNTAHECNNNKHLTLN